MLFNLTGTPAEQDAATGRGVLVVKNGVPQAFIACPDPSKDFSMSMVHIDPAHADEIERTTDIFSGSLDGALFSSSSQLYPQASVLRSRIFISAMKNSGFTIRALADETGVSPNIIQGLRNGTRDPQATTLRRLADALETTMDDLWPSQKDENDMKNQITKKSINAALSRLSHFSGYAIQEGGYAPKFGFLDLVIARVLDDGTICIRDYAVGEGKEEEDYHRTGRCVEITDIIQNWIDGRIDRAAVIDEIQKLFNEN